MTVADLLARLDDAEQQLVEQDRYATGLTVQLAALAQVTLTLAALVTAVAPDAMRPDVLAALAAAGVEVQQVTAGPVH